MIPSQVVSVLREACLSRIRGGDPATWSVIQLDYASFPHTRGRDDLPERLKRSARRQFGALSLLRVKARCAFNASEGCLRLD